MFVITVIVTLVTVTSTVLTMKITITITVMSFLMTAHWKRNCNGASRYNNNHKGSISNKGFVLRTSTSWATGLLVCVGGGFGR